MPRLRDVCPCVFLLINAKTSLLARLFALVVCLLLAFSGVSQRWGIVRRRAST